MKVSRTLFVILLMSVINLVVAYELPKIHPLYLEESASTDYTNATIRDSDDFLWIATDNGLKRYDGYNLKVFRGNGGRHDTISTGAVNALLIDSKSRLWAAGTNLNRFHAPTETFTTYHLTNNRSIRSIIEDYRGNFWLGGEGFGLLEFNPLLGDVVNRYFGDTNKGYIRCLLAAEGSSKIWVASADGLYQFDTVSHTMEPISLPLEFGMGVEAIRSMDVDSQKQLWVATNKGLLVLNQENEIIRHYRADPKRLDALSTDALWSVKHDSRGQVWVGTDKHGLHKYAPETNSFIHYPASAYDTHRLPLGSITNIYEDNRGTLWVSTGPFGVYRISEHLEKFSSLEHSFESDNSLSFNNVLDLEEDRDGNIWIASDGGGLNRYNPDTKVFTHYRHDPEDRSTLGSNSVISLAADDRGYIWVGTWGGGLNRLNPKTGKVKRILRNASKNFSVTLGNNNIFRIEVMSDNRLLLSIWRLGMQIYNPEDGSFEAYFPMDSERDTGIKTFSVVDFLRLKNGDYLLAGYQGLERFSPKEKKVWSLQFPMYEPVNDLHLDLEGFIWVATNKKLIRYNPITNSADYFGLAEGLPSEYVVSIEQDQLGYLWLGTRKGLARFDPNTLDVLAFDEEDGLVGTNFNRFSHLQTRDGGMYFGGTEGISFFNPANLPRNEYAPKVHITGLELFQQSVMPGSRWLEQTVNYTDKLVLPHSQQDITLEFTALNFISPAKNRFRFRLYGWEEEWVTTDASRRRVRYTNLSAGDYIFQVLGSNNEGVWAGRVQELHLTILPAWWQTWWARAIYVFIGLLLMYAFSYWRLRSNRQREQELKLLVSEQTSQLKMANRSVIKLNSELEQRVEHRTRELQLEIEERRESEAKANYIAYHDSLTGLYNRAWLLNHLDDLLQHIQGGHQRFALFFVGGDRFRRINDAHGHLLGDKLLVEAASRLVALAGDNCHCVRLGSDEFTLVLDDSASQEQVVTIAEKIIQAFSEPFVIEKIRMNFGVSVGMVISDSEYTETSQVLRNANIAMQRAKDSGRGVHQMFDELILRHTLESVALEADLKQALKRNQFSVVYQPIIVMKTGALSGFEVLLRWNHPQRGMVPPDKFIPMAEASGSIFEIGLWVLSTACQQLKTWKQLLQIDILPTIAVNLSPVQLGQADLLQRVDAVFEEHNVDRRQIKLEITESALMKHTDTVDQLLESLRERGIELAIDDFGTGYSSLSYLDKLPVQVLKIDRAFVNALFDESNENNGAHEIVRATISLAHNLKMRVVAEGIETQEQMDALFEYLCDYGQGYKIARPLTPDDATAFLQNSEVQSLPKL